MMMMDESQSSSLPSLPFVLPPTRHCTNDDVVFDTFFLCNAHREEKIEICDR
jgi:hypothetical protein